MKTRRAFQIVLAVLATLAALAFCALAILVLVPIASGNKFEGLKPLVDGIYKMFNVNNLSTMQVVLTESFILAPFVLTATAAILLFANHGIQGVYKFSYVILMLSVAVPGIAMCVFGKQLFGAQQVMATFITAAIVVLYLLMGILTWLIKVDPAEDKAAAEARKAAKKAAKLAKKNAAATEQQPEDTAQAEVADEQTAEQPAVVEEDPTAKHNRITVKRVEILQDLLKQRKISTMQYAALVEYVLSK